MLNKYNCLVVDDETLAQELLKSHIAQIPEFNLIATCHTAVEAMSVLKSNPIDILFLDIQMPNLTGLDFLRSLENPPLTIFTTAYSEYAVEGFELNATDYLLKPISFNRFFKTANKVLNILNKQSSLTQNNAVHNYLFVKSDGKAIKLKFADILFIESLEKYVRFYTSTQKVITLMSLTKLESLLPTNFMRIHKSYIVNLEKIVSVEGNRVHIENNYTANISKTIKPELMKRLDGFGLL
ncbi:LytR/AlgR family response regulator transcription factor [Pseudofulvibacter geojedonensis]|uniref:LytR/AlgR family response regulator transcription factor n=1 Tax=Pseudofulvibacter geojedonensis TaxID=1123758 RepID=A0ABW3I4T9_9FLAO